MRQFKHPSVMTHDFSQVPSADIQRSTFKRNRGYKTTFDAGYLIPIFVDEALPGDTYRVSLSSIARLATPLRPFVDNLHMDFFFFAVPNRLVWDNWQKFCGERANPSDSISYNVPQMTSPAGGWLVGTLQDYMGIPTEVTGISVNSLHMRAYNLIWNEWFRHQDLQNSVVVDTDDGPDTESDYVLLRRGKRHDYFTSALPYPQKGATAIDLPLGSTAPVVTGADQTYDATNTTAARFWDASTGSLSTSNSIGISSGGTMGKVTGSVSVTSPYFQPANLYADLSSATAATINSLREAFQMQKMLERDARGGTRYTELLLSHFRVRSPDQRLQRPEYLGGGTTRVNITPVPQTSESNTTKQGTLAAVGYQANSGIGFTKSFVEHCVIVGLANVRADITYQDGLDRMWTRQTRYDYYWPSLAHLGEQEILNQEILADGTATDDDVWGYQERWAEYRYSPSKITGKLRSSYATSLDVWHLAEDFGGTRPALNAAFMECDPPVDRVIAVPSEPHFVFDGYFNVLCTRPMPMYSVPGLIDHF